jgi:hypothetical protein
VPANKNKINILLRMVVFKVAFKPESYSQRRSQASDSERVRLARSVWRPAEHTFAHCQRSIICGKSRNTAQPGQPADRVIDSQPYSGEAMRQSQVPVSKA